MDFPQYRISKNGKNLYRIDSNRVFIELQYIGEKVLLFIIEAKTYPEMVRIQDLLDRTADSCDVLDAQRFEDIKNSLQAP